MEKASNGNQILTKNGLSREIEGVQRPGKAPAGRESRCREAPSLSEDDAGTFPSTHRRALGKECAWYS